MTSWSCFEGRGIPMELRGVERLLAACARNDAEGWSRHREREPQLVEELLAEGGKLLAEFAGVGNTDGVRHLLDLGVAVGARYEEGDGYFDVAKDSTALHVAAWRARHATVKLLIERGAPVDERGRQGTHAAGAGRARLRGLVLDRARRSPESVEALLPAGASVSGVPLSIRLRRGGRALAIARALGSGLISARSRCALSESPISTRPSGKYSRQRRVTSAAVSGSHASSFGNAGLAPRVDQHRRLVHARGGARRGVAAAWMSAAGSKRVKVVHRKFMALAAARRGSSVSTSSGQPRKAGCAARRGAGRRVVLRRRARRRPGSRRRTRARP